MKAKLKALGILIVIWGNTLQSPAQGQIIPNGVVDNLFPGEIDLVWPAATQINGFQFLPVGKTSNGLPYTNIFTFSEPLTIGVRVFRIALNQPFSLTTITAGTYPEISSSINPSLPASPTNIFNVNVPFFVALYSGTQFAEYYPSDNTRPVYYTDPVFGWAKLVNNRGVIQLLDGALAYGSGGIYAGTQNVIPVPEPGGLALLSAGLLLSGIFRGRIFSKLNCCCRCKNHEPIADKAESAARLGG